MSRRSFRFNPAGFNDLLPACKLLPLEFGELLGRVPDDFETLFRQAFLYVLAIQSADDRAMQFALHVCRQAFRCGNRLP